MYTIALNEGGLFEINATLSLMAIQFVFITFVLTTVYYKPVQNIFDRRAELFSLALYDIRLTNELRNNFDWLTAKLLQLNWDNYHVYFYTEYELNTLGRNVMLQFLLQLLSFGNDLNDLSSFNFEVLRARDFLQGSKIELTPDALSFWTVSRRKIDAQFMYIWREYSLLGWGGVEMKDLMAIATMLFMANVKTWMSRDHKLRTWCWGQGDKHEEVKVHIIPSSQPSYPGDTTIRVASLPVQMDVGEITRLCLASPFYIDGSTQVFYWKDLPMCLNWWRVMIFFRMRF